MVGPGVDQALSNVMRFEEVKGKIARIRGYSFCCDTLRAIAASAKNLEEAARHAEEDRVRAELVRVQARVEGLLESNENTFKEFGDLLDPEPRDQVRSILAETRQSLQDASVQSATEALERLGEASRILSEVILFRPGAQGVKEALPRDPAERAEREEAAKEGGDDGDD